MTDKCVVCETPFPAKTHAGYKKKFCSDACKQRNNYWKRSGVDRPRIKACVGCNGEFSLVQRNPDGKLRRSDARWCTDCRPDNDRDPIGHMTKRLFYRYGITREQYAEASQVGCEICGRTDVKLHVDHDHACCGAGDYTCGKCVRGFLCGSCNRGIGMFGEDANRILAAAAYLLKQSDVIRSATTELKSI